MNDILEYKGYWYENSNSEVKVSGTLKIEKDDGKIQLDINGCFDTFFPDCCNINYKTINGIISNGKKITLIDSYLLNKTMHFPGYQVSTYSAKYIIEGEEYNNIDDIKISSIESKYTNLNKWIMNEPFNVEFNDKEKTISMIYDLPNKDEYKINNYIVKINIKEQYSCDRYTKFEMFQNTSIIFETEVCCCIMEGLEKVKDFSKFLTLCIGENITPYEISAVDTNNQKIKLYINGLKYKENSKKNINDILIPYPLIKDNFTQCLENWIKKKELLQPIMSYFMGANNDVFNIPVTFLLLVQALEAFARRMGYNCNIPQNKYAIMLNDIVSCLKTDTQKEFIKDKLKYSYEFPLRKILDNIFKETDFLLHLPNKNRTALIFKITETRHYYTHFDIDKKDKILDTNDIFYVGKYMLFVLRALILKELGISDELIKKRVTNSSNFYFVKKNIDNLTN